MRIAILADVNQWEDRQWREFVSNAKSMFLPTSQHQYYIFSDRKAPTNLPEDITWCLAPVEKSHGNSKGCWLPTLPAELLGKYDFIFCFKSPLLFKRQVGVDFLSDSPKELVVVQHPKYVNRPPNRLPFERNSRSSAFVPKGEGLYYVTDQLVGGSPLAYSAMVESIHRHHCSDFRNGVVAEGLLEAHLNRYIVDHPHSIRHAGFCYPRGWDLGVPKMMESSSGYAETSPEVSRGSTSQIIVKLDGDLGDQLFQYANALAMKEKSGGSLWLDTHHFDRNPQHHYHLGQLNISAQIACRSMLPQQSSYSFRSLLPGRLGRLYETDRERDVTIVEEGSYIRCRHTLHHPGRFYFRGPWHHETLFEKLKQKLRSEFGSSESISKGIAPLLETIRESTGVALDLRRNTSSPISNSLTAVEQKVADYINGAIDRIQQIASKAPKLYVFSDNIPWADRILGLRGDIHYVDTCTQVSQIDTLRLMSACQYHLISNSKLAWWAAWLNTSKERQVVIPSVVLAKSIWRDYLPVMENWYAMDESYCQSQISNAA